MSVPSPNILALRVSDLADVLGLSTPDAQLFFLRNSLPRDCTSSPFFESGHGQIRGFNDDPHEEAKSLGILEAFASLMERAQTCTLASEVRKIQADAREEMYMGLPQMPAGIKLPKTLESMKHIPEKFQVLAEHSNVRERKHALLTLAYSVKSRVRLETLLNSTARTGYGIRCEPLAIAQWNSAYDAKTQISVSSQQTTIETMVSDHVMLRGRLDGMLPDGTVVEIKHRTQSLSRLPPADRDLLQTHCYMFMTGTTQALLLEAMKEDIHSYWHREHEITFDNDFWLRVVESLEKFAMLRQRMKDDRMLSLMFFSNTREVQQQILSVEVGAVCVDLNRSHKRKRRETCTQQTKIH